MERTTASVTVDASVDDCYKFALNVEEYPSWVEGIESVEVLSRDADGRIDTVRFRAEALGRSTNYVLRYHLQQAPNELAWSIVTGDVARVIEGRYVFTDVSDGASAATKIDYDLQIDLIIPLPGFIKRRAEDKIIDSALSSFKEQIEGTRQS